MSKLDPRKSERAWFLPWNTGWTHSVAFLGGNERLAAGNQYGDILVWDLPGRMPREEEYPDKELRSDDDDDEYSYPVLRPRLMLRGHDNLVWRMAASPDGKLLYSASWDHTVRIWDLEASPEETAEVDLFTGERRLRILQRRGFSEEYLAPQQVDVATSARVLDGHDEWIRGFSMTPDRKHLLTADDAGVCILWELPSGSEVSRFQLETGGWAKASALSPDAGRALVCEPYDRHGERRGSITLWDVPSGEMIKSYDYAEHKQMWGRSSRVISYTAAAFAPDGEHVALGQTKLQFFEVDSGKLVWEEDGHGRSNGVKHIEFSRDGEFILSSGRDTQVRIRQAKDGKQVAEVGFPRGGQFKDWIHHFDLSPDEQWLATADMAGMAHVWRFAS